MGGCLNTKTQLSANLGVALLQAGNRASFSTCGSFYQEAEDLFLSALKLGPKSTAAERNLAAVRKNKRPRQHEEHEVPK